MSHFYSVPVVSLAGMNEVTRRHVLLEEIAAACRHNGIFQVIDHGISSKTLEMALSVASAFFDLPAQDKAKFASGDVFKPVRYGTGMIAGGLEKVQLLRVFLKHYSHPLHHWIESWPHTPPDYRSKMGEYVEAMHKLAKSLVGFITESLGLGRTYLDTKLDSGMQVVAVNNYPLCPYPDRSLGLPPHSDYGCLTVVLQDSPGLQILDPVNKSWRTVPVVENSLQVHVGDQLEVLSNGTYKSVVHRVIVAPDRTRVSIAGLHCLGMDEKIRVATEMIDENCPDGSYRESCFRDFLDFISRNDVSEGSRFLDTIKLL